MGMAATAVLTECAYSGVMNDLGVEGFWGEVLPHDMRCNFFNYASSIQFSHHHKPA